MADWLAIRNAIRRITRFRIFLYAALMATSVVILAVSFYFWAGELEYGGFGETWREASTTNWALGHVADVLHYFLPDFFSNLITYGILKQPYWGPVLLVVVIGYYALRQYFKRLSDEACETARVFVMRHTGRST